MEQSSVHCFPYLPTSNTKQSHFFDNFIENMKQTTFCKNSDIYKQKAAESPHKLSQPVATKLQ